MPRCLGCFRKLILFLTTVTLISSLHLMSMVLKAPIYDYTAPAMPQASGQRVSVMPTTVHMALHYANVSCDLAAERLLGPPHSIREAGCTDSGCLGITCSNLLRGHGNESVYNAARAYQKSHPKRHLPAGYFDNVSSNCEDFRKVRGYHSLPLSKESEEFPIAYNVLVHTDLEQVELLLRAIYRPQNSYCIHIDAKSSTEFHNSLSSVAECFDNVFIASKLEKITYAGYTRLQADINCFHDQLANGSKWRYLLNVAGQSFPLMTNEEMVEVLKIYNGANDIEGISKRIVYSRFQSEWVEKNGTMARTGKKNPSPPHDIMIVRGSAYGVFSRELVTFILADQRAVDLLKWSRTTWSPDEHYWATLHHTSCNPHLHTPGGYSGVPDEKPWLAVFVLWGGRDKCQGQWRHGVCIFGVGDLPVLLSRKEFFANKFYQDFQPLGLECMANWIDYKTRCPQQRDLQYYTKLPFIKKPGGVW